METLTIIGIAVLAVLFLSTAAFIYGYYLGSRETKPLTPRSFLLIFINSFIKSKNGSSTGKSIDKPSRGNVAKKAPQKRTTKNKRQNAVQRRKVDTSIV